MCNCLKYVQTGSCGYLLARLSDPSATGHSDCGIALGGQVALTVGSRWGIWFGEDCLLGRILPGPAPDKLWSLRLSSRTRHDLPSPTHPLIYFNYSPALSPLLSAQALLRSKWLSHSHSCVCRRQETIVWHSESARSLYWDFSFWACPYK